MVKAIKVMLIPNNVQKTKMFQYAGASRFAYNWALAREIENYEKGGQKGILFDSAAARPVSDAPLVLAIRRAAGCLWSSGSARGRR